MFLSFFLPLESFIKDFSTSDLTTNCSVMSETKICTIWTKKVKQIMIITVTMTTTVRDDHYALFMLAGLGTLIYMIIKGEETLKTTKKNLKLISFSFKQCLKEDIFLLLFIY